MRRQDREEFFTKRKNDSIKDILNELLSEEPQ